MASHNRKRSNRRKSRKNSFSSFYILLGVVLVVGIALIAGSILSPKQSVAVNAVPAELDPTLPSKGDPNAPVTVVEYADFQCPGCANFALQMQESFIRDYVDTGKVRLVYHDFPLSQHRNAVPAAEAARCANEQGEFWQMSKMLFANQAAWGTNAQPNGLFVAYAEQMGLDKAAFEKCLADKTYRNQVLSAQQAAIQANIMQTPTFVINGQQYTSGELRAAVDRALAEASN